jgi:uncharacterized membrane protein YoaK (UPF0700 family)
MQKAPDEYVPLQWRAAAWMCYVCTVCGCINGMAISSSGLFRMSVTGLTGTTTRAAISVAGGDQRSGWLVNAGAGDDPTHLFMHVLGFGCGAFIAGVTLVRKTGNASKKHTSIRMDYPSAREWRWQHQLLLSACLLCAAAAHLLSRDRDVNSASGPQPHFVASLSLTACLVAILNCMFMLGGSPFIALRACAVTGIIADLFMLLGSALRSRSARYLWKARSNAIILLCFFTGALIGAVITREDNAIPRSHCHVVIIMLLSPLWLVGIGFIAFNFSSSRLLSLSKPLSQRDATVNQQPVPTPAASSPPTSPSEHSLSIVESLSPSLNPVERNSVSTLNPSLTLNNGIENSGFIEDDFPDEFENEGLGLPIENESLGIPIENESLGIPIYRLPRINVLEDELKSVLGPSVLGPEDDGNCRSSEVPPIKPVALGEYETLHYAHFAWIVYLAFVAGAINAAALQGIYHTSVGHLTGGVTGMALRLKYPPLPALKGNSSFTFEAILAIIIAYGLACFMCGFVLSLPNSSGKYVLRRIDYPSVKEWRWKHQVLLSLSIISLCVAFAVARSFTGDAKDFAYTVKYQESSSTGFLFACCCAAFAAGVLNTLSSLGRRITVRSSHLTGSINDIFLGLGFALRCRSLRFIWRVRALAFSWMAFFAGAVASSLIFYSFLGASVLVFPIVLLAPLWVYGIALLIMQRRKYYA